MAELQEASGLVLAWGIAGMAVPALVVRTASLPLLTRAQQATRVREPEIRSGRVSPWGLPGAALADLVLGLVCAVGLTVWLGTRSVVGFEVMVSPVEMPNVDQLQRMFGLGLVPARIAFYSFAVPVLLLWLLLWFLTQRNVRMVGVPTPDGPVGGVRAPGPRLAAALVLRLLLGVFAPFGLVVAALACQIVAALVSSRVRSTPVAVPGAPAAGSFGAARPFAPVAPNPYAPTAPAGQPGTPPAPAFAPGGPAPYVPTQAAVASPVAYQQLHPNEPRSLAGYQLLGRIGAGGMGTVYLARREGSATQVALKTIHPELLDHAELLKRFEREAEVLAMVPGAYTARVLDAGVDSGRPYLAMELLDGRPLDVHLREQGPITSPEALRALALALAMALSGVHKLGLVHRDLKPANIMLTTAGPRLLDFGIAALVDGTRLTRTGGGPGTLTYMAPEQFGDEPVGTAADIWAWACCVVCAAHGASPFQATSTGAVIRRIVDTGPEAAALAAVRALDPALAAAVERALTTDPAGRPKDGAALVELLGGSTSDVRAEITRGWQTMVV
ncbi:protein kinase [Streptomyces sp. NPDC051561]|uniref:serine/threonine-protein kinase n=1 Tax=Streptomyces sp. NPDC051561 TaxID=3365658 RepID=UPI0037B03C30